MAVTTVSITGSVIDPHGVGLVKGTINARLSATGSVLDGAVSQRVAGEAQATVTAGVVSGLALVPNDAITPSGTCYVVVIEGTLTNGRRARWSERWQVAGSPATQDIGSIPRLDVVPGVAVTTHEAVQASVLAEATASQVAAAASEVAAGLAQATAEAHKDAAQAAADAAAVSAAVYPDTATGLAAVGEGGYFRVPSGSTSESLILYRDVAGVATEIKRFPSQLLADQVAWAGGQVAADEYPNLIGDPAFTASTWSAVRQIVNGRACIVHTSGAKSIRVPRAAISGSVVSASLRIESQLASSGTCRILLQQRTAALAEIVPSRQTYTIGTGAITSPVNVQFSGVSLDATCAYVDLYWEAGTGALTVSQPMVCAGTIAQFRTPPRGIVLNRFTDPTFSGTGMVSGGAGAHAVESYEDVLSFTGGVQERNYWIPVGGSLQPGAIAYLSADVYSGANDSALIGMYFLDSAGADLGSSVTKDNDTTLSAWVSVATSATIPAACVFVRIRFVKYGASGTSKFRRIALTTEYVAGQARLVALPSVTPAEVWISPTGSDANPGDRANPLASIDRAIAVLGGRGRIVMLDGDYSGAAVATAWDNAYDVQLVAEGSVRPRIIGGTKLGTITKTGGYSKVYQAAWPTAKPSVPWLWEHEVPEVGTLISAAERHPLQRGRTYRLPSTRISEVASIAAIDAASGPSWYWASNVLYFSIASGGDATGSNIYVPASGALCTRSSAKKDMPRVRLVGVELWYGELQLTGTDYELRDFLAVGAYGNGAASNLARGVEVRCEWAGCSNDGSGAHGQPEPTWPWSPVEATRLQVDPYAHDNYDDGDSIHERCSGTIIGGLWEYNGGCGIATSYGSHVTVIGGRSRRNDLRAGTKGGGFAVIGAASGLEGGVGTQMTCINCVSEDDTWGFNAAAADSLVEAIDCRVERATVAAYQAGVVGSVVRLKGCTDSGSAAVKGGLGTISVDNGATVT